MAPLAVARSLTLKEQTMQLQDAVDTFLLFKAAEALSRRTVAWYAAQLAAFAAYSGPVAVDALTPLDIAAWLVTLQSAGKSQVTVEGHYRALLCFFNWAEAAPDVGK